MAKHANSIPAPAQQAPPSAHQLMQDACHSAKAPPTAHNDNQTARDEWAYIIKLWTDANFPQFAAQAWKFRSEGMTPDRYRGVWREVREMRGWAL